MFTNTLGPRGRRAVSAVTAMMELWEACFFLLILDLTIGKDISPNATAVVRQIASCPAEGYFFKREPAPNLVGAGPCYLCFCRNHGTATCWERDPRRCDVEKYHHHRVGRHSRFRRSFSNVFFRDATRDFFGKNLPQQCKPYESSFSEGCPPADWCVGCTICDCDSNGRWDCHILSFCDGKEKKTKIKALKSNKKKATKKNVDYDYPIEVKKRAPTRKTSKKTTTKPKTTKMVKKNIRKVVKAKPKPRTNKSKPRTNNSNTRINKTNTRINRTNKRTKKQSNKLQASKKVTRRAQNKAMSRSHPKSNVSKGKIIKKVVATRKPVTLNRNAAKELKLNSNNSDTIKLGQKIVKQVMTTFKKMLAKEVDKLNETKKIKLMDGKDCGGVKKRDKRTYNVISKAVARNKNKYNRLGKLKENYTNSRIKREILNQEQANVENISVITLPTDINAVIPLDMTKEENSYLTNSPGNVTSIPISTSQRSKYYEYTISKNESYWTTTTEITKNLTENQDSKIENNFIIPAEFNNDISDTPPNNVTESANADMNDYQNIPKWNVIKIKNDEPKKAVTRLILPKPSTTMSLDYRVRNEIEYFVSKLQNNKMEFINDVTKKYEYTTLASSIYRKPCCTKPLKEIGKTDATGVKNILQNLYTELNKTKSAKRKQKPKISVLKYVRKLFTKIFSKKRTGNHKYYGLGSNEDHTLQILCENIGPCKIKRNNRMILKYKLKQLSNETKTVLKSIRIVKGLLHLLELPNDVKTSTVTKYNSFQNDIQKLGFVLKDYKDSDMNSALLTDTQKTQIDYIKKNTQTFINSVKKFADILTDILAIIRPNTKNDQPRKSPPKQKNYTSSFNKIKKILNQYNIVQNTFMRRMYELINGEEKKSTTTERPLKIASNRNSKSNALEKYSQKIIENLRKLKNLAHVLNSKRKKRELTMRDDALDYLLSLMEMFIRQNRFPVERYPGPASDGIDLLIDAIKNAPEIKTIPHKESDYIQNIHLSKPSSTDETSDQATSDTSSDSKRVSNEENTTDSEFNVISKYNVMANAKPEELTVQAIDEDVTQKVYYRVFNSQNDNDYDSTTKNDSISKNRSNEEHEKIGFDKFESYLGDPKKLEAETAYIEDDPIADITTKNAPVTKNNTRVTDLNTEDHTVFVRKNPERTPRYFPRSKESSSENQDSMNDKQSKLDWIEETFDREIRMINSSTKQTTKSKQTPTPPTTSSTAKNKENNSDLTKEDHSEKSVKKTGKKTKPHDVLYEKNLQFLSSLDYGTEKSADFEETDSKEDSRSDGVFPSYFA